MTLTRKTQMLRGLVESSELSFLLEAHNGLSAKLVEEAGFQGIWASGLSISAALGVRDSNEASWTQVLEVAEFMADAVDIPILLDGDTGYGNFNSMRRLVRKLEQRGIAGVCIEDKLFPKTNSFINGNLQPLADIDEFAGKIRAGKDAQTDDAFVIVARVEALIAGHGLREVLTRAEAYRRAGADAILIHSAKRTADEILAFKAEWGDRLPVMIVPTKYYTTPTDIFRQYGISVCIWANHMMRASLATMKETARAIFSEQNLFSVEDRVAPLAEVFRLQGAAELEAAEEEYLPRAAGGARAVILAASRGRAFGELTASRPKCMLDIGGKPLLDHIITAYRSAGVKGITVVRGYHKDKVDLPGVDYVDNDRYESSREVGSLLCALSWLDGPTIVSFGNVLFKKYILLQLIDATADITIAVDADWRDNYNRPQRADQTPLPIPTNRQQRDYIACSAPCSRQTATERPVVRAFVSQATSERIDGIWMGFLRLSSHGTEILRSYLKGLDPGEAAGLRIPDVLQGLIAKKHKIEVIYTVGHWLDVTSYKDIDRAGRF